MLEPPRTPEASLHANHLDRDCRVTLVHGEVKIRSHDRDRRGIGRVDFCQKVHALWVRDQKIRYRRNLDPQHLTRSNLGLNHRDHYRPDYGLANESVVGANAVISSELLPQPSRLRRHRRKKKFLIHHRWNRLQMVLDLGLDARDACDLDLVPVILGYAHCVAPNPLWACRLANHRLLNHGLT